MSNPEGIGGIQPGEVRNPEGTNKRPWREAIKRAIKRRQEDDPRALEKLADKLLRQVDKGDVAAMREFGNRLDGMPKQVIIGGDEDDPPVKHSLSQADTDIIERFLQERTK